MFAVGTNQVEIVRSELQIKSVHELISCAQTITFVSVFISVSLLRDVPTLDQVKILIICTTSVLVFQVFRPY